MGSLVKKSTIGLAVSTCMLALAVSATCPFVSYAVSPSDLSSASGKIEAYSINLGSWEYDSTNKALTVVTAAGQYGGLFYMGFEGEFNEVRKLTITGQAGNLSAATTRPLCNIFPNLESVSIGSGITSLPGVGQGDTGYLGGFKYLKSVDFSNATDLHSLNASYLFSGSTALTKLDLSKSSITGISDDASKPSGLLYGSSITEIVLPENLVTLGQNSLARQSDDGNALLTTVVLPSGVKTVGQDAFARQTSLKAIYVPSTIESFNSSQDKMGRTTAGSVTELIVYGDGATTEPEALQAIKNASDANKVPRIKGIVLPALAKQKIQELAANASDIDKVCEAELAYANLSEAAKACPGMSWDDVETSLADAWKKALGTADAVSYGEKLSALVNFYKLQLESAQSNLEKAESARDSINAELVEMTHRWQSASETASSVTSMKANYERQLKEAQAKVDEAQAKVEELENLLDPAAVAANKAKIISLQDKLAISAIVGGSKVVKLNKKGKTKAKATVKLKLVKSESGAAVACVKAKGTNKNVSVSDDGVLTLKKGVKKGTYKAKVKLTCGNATKTVTYTFKAA